MVIRTALVAKTQKDIRAQPHLSGHLDIPGLVFGDEFLKLLDVFRGLRLNYREHFRSFDWQASSQEYALDIREGHMVSYPPLFGLSCQELLPQPIRRAEAGASCQLGESLCRRAGSSRRMRISARIRKWLTGPKSDPSGRSGEICVTGNAVRTLIRFGYLHDPTVQRSIAWIVRTQKADGGWHCFPSRTGTLDGWEGLAALSEIPEEYRDESVRRSIERGAEFYLRRHLMEEGKGGYL